MPDAEVFGLVDPPASLQPPAGPAGEPELVPAVVLKGRSERVVLRVPAGNRGLEEREAPPLTTAEYDVVQALIAAGPNGLTGSELSDRSHRTDARRNLERLKRKYPEWAQVIDFPGGGYKGGYRVRHHPVPPKSC